MYLCVTKTTMPTYISHSQHCRHSADKRVVWEWNNLAVVFSFQLKAVHAFPDCLVSSIIHVLLKDCWKQVLKNYSFVTWCCLRLSAFTVIIYIGRSFRDFFFPNANLLGTSSAFKSTFCSESWILKSGNHLKGQLNTGVLQRQTQVPLEAEKKKSKIIL